MTNYPPQEQYPPQEYYRQQYTPPVPRQNKGLAVAAFVCSTVELALVLLGFALFAAHVEGAGGFFLVCAFLLLVVVPVLLLILITKR